MLRKLDNGQAETSRFLAAERDLLALGVEYLPLPEIGREGKGLISGFIPGQTRVRKDTTSATTGGEEGRNFSIGSHISLRGDEAERLLSGRERFGIWKNRRGVTNLGKQLNCSSLVKPSSIPPFCIYTCTQAGFGHPLWVSILFAFGMKVRKRRECFPFVYELSVYKILPFPN